MSTKAANAAICSAAVLHLALEMPLGCNESSWLGEKSSGLLNTKMTAGCLRGNSLKTGCLENFLPPFFKLHESRDAQYVLLQQRALVRQVLYITWERDHMCIWHPVGRATMCHPFSDPSFAAELQVHSGAWSSWLANGVGS